MRKAPYNAKPKTLFRKTSIERSMVTEPGIGKTAALSSEMRKAPLLFREHAMSWKYSQSTGELVNPTGSGVGIGYSGRGAGLNSPAHQSVADVGPIPQGEWVIGSFFDDPGGKGPIVAHLVPASGTETFGRSGFMIHGDNAELDHTASEGCIILPRVVREMVMASSVRGLIVTA